MVSSRPASRTASRPNTPSQAHYPGTQQTQQPVQPQDPANAVRLMQVKVLYTFDADSNTNCLARCRQPLNIQTAVIENGLQIGIVELRTCIDAIVAGSPELMPKLGKDYTVYAYDYSEYEAPLVGQGMLSRVLAASSSTPFAPAHESRTMVTGRVTRNNLAIFSGGVPETLEVKLRLVPVPTVLEDEYLAGMEQYRDNGAEGLNASAWSDFVKNNPTFARGPPSQTALSMQAQEIQPALQRRDSQGSAHNGSSTPSLPMLAPQPSAPAFNHFVTYTAPQETQASAASESTSARGKPRSQSRPSSRASNRGGSRQPRRRKSEVPSTEPVSSAEGVDAEEGPSKKRARITKADWNGPSNFAANSESLRVAASTAASVRGVGPAPTIHPLASEIAAGEVPSLRPPTPRPSSGLVPRRGRGGPVRPKSSRARDSSNIEESKASEANTPKGSEYAIMDSSAAESSPEKEPPSAGSTPFDLPSSPPAMPQLSPAPSSPVLPQLNDLPDSGFASGNLEDCANSDVMDWRSGTDFTPVNRPGLAPGKPSNLTSELVVDELQSTEFAQPLRKILPRPESREEEAPDVPPTSPKLPPLEPADSNESNDNELDLESMLVSAINDEPAPSRRSEPPPPESDGFIMSDPKAPPPKLARSGSSHRRKALIQQKLAESIAAGEMPTFCYNCGEISTPTWRKIYLKQCEGSPDRLKASIDKDAIVAFNNLSYDEQGHVTSYRVLKKSLLTSDDGYEEQLLCNPCGVYFYKHVKMRPLQMTIKQPANPDSRHARRSRKSVAKESEPPSEAADAAPTTLQNLNSELGGAPAEEPFLDGGLKTGKPPPKADGEELSSRSSESRNDSSTRLSESGLDPEAAQEALKRAILSSPPKFPGSKFSPIDLDADATPHPTRRTLFPSPRRAGEHKSLEITENGDSPKEVSPSSRKEKKNRERGNTATATPSPTSDKENEPPETQEQGTEPLDNVPTTPRSRRTSPRNLLKTPTSDLLRKVLTPRGILTSAAKKWQDLQRSPSKSGSGSGSGKKHAFSPFTAELNRLMSDPNLSPSRGIHSDAMNLFSDADGLMPFSDFTADELMTDMVAPTSEAFFAMYSDAVHGDWDAGNIETTADLDALLEEESK